MYVHIYVCACVCVSMCVQSHLYCAVFLTSNKPKPNAEAETTGKSIRCKVLCYQQSKHVAIEARQHVPRGIDNSPKGTDNAL